MGLDVRKIVTILSILGKKQVQSYSYWFEDRAGAEEVDDQLVDRVEDLQNSNVVRRVSRNENVDQGRPPNSDRCTSYVA